MKNKSVKTRTITITGPFGVDDEGDEYGAPREVDFVYLLHELKSNPAFDYRVEDAPRELPTEKGALIRATVMLSSHADDVLADQILILEDESVVPWRALTEAGGWYTPSRIGDDWVELVPRSE